MKLSEQQQRLLALVRLLSKGKPCEISMRDIATILGISRYKARSLVDELNGKEFVFSTENRRCTFYPKGTKDSKGIKDISLAPRTSHLAPPPSHLPPRTCYGTNVWLSDNEYEGLLSRLGGEKERQLAIDILAAWKEKKGNSQQTGDFLHLITWVKDIIEEKKKKKEQHRTRLETERAEREEVNKQNEERIAQSERQGISREDYQRRKDEFLKTHSLEEWFAMLNNKKQTKDERNES